MFGHKLQINKSKNGMGNGLFTDIDIPANKPIIQVNGEIHTKKTMPDPNHPAWCQISPTLFIGPSGSYDDYVNHSCEPNSYLCIVGKRAILYSLFLIRAGSEITFDYSTTSTQSLDEWNMACFCGTQKCRNIISGYQYLEPDLKKIYESRGMIPMYLTNPMFKGT